MDRAAGELNEFLNGYLISVQVWDLKKADPKLAHLATSSGSAGPV